MDDDGDSCSVDCSAELSRPPIRRAEPGKLDQLTRYNRDALRLWEVVQVPAAKLTQLAPELPFPPHAANPAWVCPSLSTGSGGSVHVVPYIYFYE